MSNYNHNDKPSVQKGVRQADVTQLADTILQDDSMDLPMVPDVVKRIIYQSTIKLTFNLFYKGISQLDGAGLVTASSSSGSSTSSSSSREIRLDRTFVDNNNDTAEQQQQQRTRSSSWKSFQQSTIIDNKPLENFADQLIKNKAVNVTVIPDAIEKDIYVNCLKIIFWVLNIITSHVKITFCGHTISMNLTPTITTYYFNNNNNARGGGGGGTTGERGNGHATSIIKQINSFMVNKNTIQEFSQQGMALLKMDGNGVSGTSTTNTKGGAKGTMKNLLKSSLNKVQQEMIKYLNMSLYGIILAIVDDLLSSTKIEILNDQISLRVVASSSSPSSSASNKQNSNNNNSSSSNPSTTRPQPSSSPSTAALSPLPPIQPPPPQETMDDVSLAVEATMADLTFSQQRAILLQRSKQWSPEERAIILRDLAN